MLIGIPEILSPELLKILMEMGHGDEIVLADGNFPAASMGKRVARCDGHPVVPLLDAVLRFFPLDTFVQKPVLCMAVVAGDKTQPAIWNEFRKTIAARVAPTPEIAFLERFDFYERAKQAYAVVATGERALYANVILKKGVVPQT